MFILEHRVLADAGDELSLAEIGTHFDVSRERVRQLEARAHAKLRRAALETPGVEASEGSAERAPLEPPASGLASTPPMREPRSPDLALATPVTAAPDV